MAEATRICIYNADVMMITGRSVRYSRNLLNDIRKHYKKQKHQLVTIDDFCQYMGFDKNEIAAKLK